MILLSKTKLSKDLLKAHVFEIRLQANISFRICATPNIPLTLELGLLFITFSYEIFNFKTK